MMDGIIWTARVLTAAVFGVAFLAAVAVAMVAGWFFGREEGEDRWWERDLYSEELDK